MPSEQEFLEEQQSKSEDIAAMEAALQESGDEVEIPTDPARMEEIAGSQPPDIDEDKEIGTPGVTRHTPGPITLPGTASDAPQVNVDDEKAIVAPAPTEPDEFEKSLEEIKARPNAKSTTVKALDAIKGKAKEAHQRYKEEKLAREAAEKKVLEASSKPIPEEVEKELTELRTDRRNRDVQSDPEFQQKFDAPIQQHAQEAVNLLKEWGLPESSVNFINEHGGLTQFQASNELIPDGTPNSQNSDGSQMSQSEWFDKVLMPRLSSFQRDELRDHLGEARKLGRAKVNAMKDAAANYDTWKAGKEKEREAGAKDYQTRLETRIRQIVEEIGEYAKKEPIPTGATAEQKAVIDKKNARVDRAAGRVQRYALDNSPESRAEQAMYASFKLEADELLKEKDTAIATEKKRADDAEAKLNAIKNAGKTSKLTSAPPPSTKAPKVNLDSDVDVMSAMVREAK